MSSDSSKPFDAPPEQTPELLQQEMSLDRRAPRAPEKPTDPMRPMTPRPADEQPTQEVARPAIPPNLVPRQPAQEQWQAQSLRATAIPATTPAEPRPAVPPARVGLAMSHDSSATVIGPPRTAPALGSTSGQGFSVGVHAAQPSQAPTIPHGVQSTPRAPASPSAATRAPAPMSSSPHATAQAPAPGRAPASAPMSSTPVPPRAPPQQAAMSPAHATAPAPRVQQTAPAPTRAAASPMSAAPATRAPVAAQQAPMSSVAHAPAPTRTPAAAQGPTSPAPAPARATQQAPMSAAHARAPAAQMSSPAPAAARSLTAEPAPMSSPSPRAPASEPSTSSPAPAAARALTAEPDPMSPSPRAPAAEPSTSSPTHAAAEPAPMSSPSPRAPAAEPSMSSPAHARPPAAEPAMSPSHARPTAQPASMSSPAHAAAMSASPETARSHVAPAAQDAGPRPVSPTAATRPSAPHTPARAEPPSPVQYAQQRPLPQITPNVPSLGGVVPEGQSTIARTGHPGGQFEQPLGELDHPTTPAAPAQRAPTPMPIQLPTPRAAPSLPRELLVTQPGLPGPFAGKQLPQNRAVPERPQSLPELPAVAAREAPQVDDTVTAEPAALWRRVGAWLTDLVFVAVMVLGLLTIATTVIAPKNLTPLQQLQSIAVPGLALAAILSFVYTSLFAFLWDGRTPGRRVMGIHLVDTSGHAPAPLRALVRAMLSLVSFGLFLSGFWLALFDRHGQTLHDKLTRTFVVKLQDA